MRGNEMFEANGRRDGSYSDRPVDFGGQWGYYGDSETGLTLLGHRYYDSYAGRFLTRDPIGYNGGVNLYAYTANDYENEDDPSGFLIAPYRPLSPWQRFWNGVGDATGKAGRWLIDPLNQGNSHLSDSPINPLDMIGGAGVGGQSYKKQYCDRYNGTKPDYTNPGHHDPKSPNFRGGGPKKTTILPDDAEHVYDKAVPDETGKNWYGRGKDGDIYRYSGSGEGNPYNHWNGREYSEDGLEVPSSVRRRLGPTGKP